jgi:hypothetical protein
MTTTAELLVVLPVLGRPHRALPLLQSLKAATPEPFNVLVVATRGDTAVQAAYTFAIADLVIAGLVDVLGPRGVGDYAAKVNHAYRVSTEPFIFLGADDLEFHHGWWTSAKAILERDPTVGVLGTNDLAPTDRSRRGEHSTHSVVRRSYVEAHGLIDGGDAVLYEGYIHEYVDDELVGTAKKRGAWCYDVNSVVEHLHPHWGKGPMDQTYRRSHARMARSRALFQSRSRLWR